jgi:ABC-2 type transport system permease protein
MTAMKSILTVASCENQKIYRQQKYRILPAVTAAVIAAGAFVGLIPGNFFRLTMANYPFTVLSLMNYIIAPLAAFMLAADLLSVEMAGNEIKVLLTRPVSRISVFLAKALSIAGYAGLLFAEGLILSCVFSAMLSGFSSFSIAAVLSAYTMGFIPALTITAMSVMIASALKSGTSCFGFCLFAYTGFAVFGLVFSRLSPVLFTSYLGIGSMVIGSVIPVSSLMTGIGVLAGYALVFLSAGGLKFMSKEF